MIRCVLIVLLICELAGCDGTLQSGKPDVSTGLYSTSHELSAKDVLIEEPFKSEYKIVYFRSVENPNPRFVNFFMTNLKQANSFQKILSKDDLQAIIIERDLAGRIPKVTEFTELNALSKEIGPFLIVDTNAYWQGGYNWQGFLKVTDAATGRVVLSIDKSAFNLAGLDAPLYYPMLNGLINWSRKKPLVAESERFVPAGGASSNGL